MSLQMAPEDPFLMSQRNAAMLKLGKFDDLIQQYTSAIQANPNEKENYVQRALVFADQQNYEKALPDLNAALALAPDQPIVLRHRARIHAKLKDWNEALADYDRLIQLDPSQADLYLKRAYVQSQKGEYDAAIKDYTKVIEMNPNDASRISLEGFVILIRWILKGRGWISKRWFELNPNPNLVKDARDKIQQIPEG